MATRELPGSPAVKNPLAMQGMQVQTLVGGSKIPHAMEQLSLHTTSTEP